MGEEEAGSIGEGGGGGGRQRATRPTMSRMKAAAKPASTATDDRSSQDGTTMGAKRLL